MQTSKTTYAISYLYLFYFFVFLWSYTIQATLYICVAQPTEKVVNADLFKFYEKWGEVREVRDCKTGTKYVK